MRLVHFIWALASMTMPIGEAAGGMTVHVLNTEGVTLTVDVSPDSNVHDLRVAVGAGGSVLSFQGVQLMNDADSLSDIGFGADVTVEVGPSIPIIPVEVEMYSPDLWGPSLIPKWFKSRFEVTGSNLRDFAADLRSQIKSKFLNFDDRDNIRLILSVVPHSVGIAPLSRVLSQHNVIPLEQMNDFQSVQQSIISVLNEVPENGRPQTRIIRVVLEIKPVQTSGRGLSCNVM